MNEREETSLVRLRPETKESLSVLRIYLRRRTTIRQPGVRGWFKRKSISRHLIEEALKIGITCGSVTLGHLGFVHGAKHVAEDGPEVPLGHELADAVLVRFDGAAVSLTSADLT